MTDNNGRKADFRNVILIMTTNAGAELMSRSSMGFAKQDHTTDGMEAIKKMFTPEFRNRLDGIVQFGELTMDVITTVVDKFLVQLQAQLDSKKVFLEIDDMLVSGWRKMATTRRWVLAPWSDCCRRRSRNHWRRKFCLAVCRRRCLC